MAIDTALVEAIDEERVLLCEGLQDAAFFRHLIQARGLPPFNIIHPRPAVREGDTVLRNGDAGGRQGFGSRLNALKFARHFREKVKSILVVSDKDQNAEGSFQEVRKQLLTVDYIKCPNRPEVIVENADGLKVKVMVLMVPCDSNTGSFDTMCWKAMASRHQSKFSCVESMIGCAGIGGWKEHKLDKVRTRTMLAITCEKDPNTSLAYAWSDNRGDLIPLESTCFDDVVRHLNEFSRV